MVGCSGPAWASPSSALDSCSPERAPTSFLAAYYGCYFVVTGGSIGSLAGLFGGALLYGVVRCGEPRCGPLVVARAIPVIALSVTLPVALFVGAITAVLALIVALDIVFTLAGSWYTARRYLARATS